LPPHSGLERSDFVLWRFADLLPIPIDFCYSGARTRADLGPVVTLNLADIDLPLMDEDSDGISQIEARLDELAEVCERCRKLILISKVAIAGGVAFLLVTMLGLFGSSQITAIGSITVVIGGIVTLGSNVSTLQETVAAMGDAEALRSDLISRINLRVVGDSTMKRI
jgi:hypothetical protein